MRKRNVWIILVLLLVAVFGCERRPLEEMWNSTVRVIVKCTWTITAYPDGIKPDGVTMYFFRDGAYYSQITTSNVDSCEVQLPMGHYKMYMISQSPEEYWRMQFENLTDYNTAATTLRETNVTWATRVDNEVVVENPEVMCAGVSDEFDITEKMVEDYQEYYTKVRSITKTRTKTKTKTKAGTRAEEDGDDELAYYEERVRYYTIRIPVYPKNVVSQLWVSIYSGNADVLQSVRASTSGMARTFELTQGVTGPDKAIQIMTQWNLTMDDPSRRVGHIDGIITTFGLPNGEMPSAARDSSLNVSALLVDNATIANYTFDVGDKIQVLPPNEGYAHMYRLVFGSKEEPAIILPDVRPQSGGGFVAAVEDWDDEVEANLLL